MQIVFAHIVRYNILCCYYAAAYRGIKRWCCLSSDVCLSDVCRVHLGGVCGRPAGWRVLADRALVIAGLVTVILPPRYCFTRHLPVRLL